MTKARLLYEIFYEGCTHYSIAKVSAAGKLAYYTEEGIPTLDQINDHLDGKMVLGAYNLLPNNHVRWMAFDVDSKDLDQAKEIAAQLCNFLGGIGFIVEYSGNKGYHIIIIFDREVPAKEAREVGEYIREKLGLPKSGDPHVEVYPKQDGRTESNPLGSLLRLPLGFHPSTRNKVMFVDWTEEWEQGAPLSPEELLSKRVSFEEVKKLVKEEDDFERIKSIVKPFWVDGERHRLALSLAGYLSTMAWTEEAVIQLVTELTDERGGDLKNLVECVTDTYEKVFNNQAVRGYEGLADVMSTKSLQELMKFAGNKKFKPTLQMADRIRLGKGAAFQKVRWVAELAISHFMENGSLVQDHNHLVYWNSQETKQTLIFGGNDWHRFMHSHFGINPVDSFGKQVLEAVRLFAEEKAQKINVHKRHHWNRQREVEYINLGGAEVYALNGDWSQARLIYNGDEDVFFLNSEDGIQLSNLLSDEVVPLDPFEFLVERLNFNTSESVLATPAQQKELLKALVMSYFFSEIMPTRPILVFLAEKGAGKTSAARNILRFIEGLAQDVTGILSDKPDALRSSMMEHQVLVLDNLEKTNPPWLTDVLNRVSTGGHIEVRTLYKTNALTKVVPNVNVIITATHMPFSEETVFSRMLPLELSPILNYTHEDKIKYELEANLAGFWKGMLIWINDVVKELRANPEVVMPVQMRLADFAVFCARIKKAPFMKEEVLMKGLESMVSRQRQALVQSSPLIQVLEIWIKQRPDEVKEWMPMSQLFASTKRIASSQRIEWRWTNAQGLSRHIQAMEATLKRYFGMRTRTVRIGGNEVHQYRFVQRDEVEEEIEEEHA